MKKYWSQRHLLLIWLSLGTILRLLNLSSKPLWTDEVATMVFSLGNDYQSIPLNQVISLEQLLQPLTLNPHATLNDVVHKLITQDNHPPFYFVLAHLWQQIFPSSDAYLSVGVARALPALFGILAIPLSYFLAYLCFRSRLGAQLAAGLMAVSPYAIFLAQEARHYTFGIILVILSLSCFVAATRKLYYHRVVPWYLVYGWLIINCLGLLIHYFFSLTLLAESFVLITLLLYQVKEQKFSLRHWLPLVWLGLSTLTTSLLWTWEMIPPNFGHGMTDWLEPQVNNFRTLISPVFQLLAAWITMVSLLPIESANLGVILFSGLIMIIFFLWLIPFFNQALRHAWQNREERLNFKIIGGFLLGAIALFLLIAYGLGKDITRGARYSFVYFPAVIILLAFGLQHLWQSLGQRRLVLLVFVMGFLSALTVCFNLGYQKYYKSDQFQPIIAAHSQNRVLIATSHRTLVQAGEIMALAWELKRKNTPQPLQFILVHQQEKNSPEATKILAEAIAAQPHPLDVWAVNFSAPIDLKTCSLSSASLPAISGYDYQHYLCGENVAKETVKP